MSNLMHLSVDDLQVNKTLCERNIKQLQSKVSGQKERLKWIEKYISEKTPKEPRLWTGITELQARSGLGGLVKRFAKPITVVEQLPDYKMVNAEMIRDAISDSWGGALASLPYKVIKHLGLEEKK